MTTADGSLACSCSVGVHVPRPLPRRWPRNGAGGRPLLDGGTCAGQAQGLGARPESDLAGLKDGALCVPERDAGRLAGAVAAGLSLALRPPRFGMPLPPHLGAVSPVILLDLEAVGGTRRG